VFDVAVDPSGQLSGPDRSPDEGQNHRGGQEGVGGKWPEWGGSGENPATQGQPNDEKKLLTVDTEPTAALIAMTISLNCIFG